MSKSSTAGDRAAGDQHGDTSRKAVEEQDDNDPNDELVLETVAPTLAKPIRKAGFWGAIVLSVVYLPVLANGLSSSLEFGVFLGVLGVHLGALYVGHAHRRE
ncbi:hypothetical protein RBH26_04850 [Natronolimnohabitans sp. A-GB9]|uniref:hypothetical protein n=1 Tax=Natronolimnohabitans sp. A-GB9 TaxID=3069757 RepID=UPI0027AE5B07|nr:hypothetical protein [Natronolimnohabitans sp. A-GB9]MDQ2049805.1 hypothetical protein [Natronolimnohabitans sp. A-GB9]